MAKQAKCPTPPQCPPSPAMPVRQHYKMACPKSGKK